MRSRIFESVEYMESADASKRKVEKDNAILYYELVDDGNINMRYETSRATTSINMYKLIEGASAEEDIVIRVADWVEKVAWKIR